MIIRPKPNGELRRCGDDVWRATGPDPQLLIERPRFGPRYLIVELEALDRPLDAALYLRERGGFSEEERVDFPEARRLLLALDLAEGPARRGVRLDPAEHAGTEFRLRLTALRTARGLATALRKRLARAPGLVAQLIGPAGGVARSLAASQARLRRPLIGRPGLRQNLARIWELAAIEASLDPLPVPGTPEISFLVPVYDAEPAWLDALLASFERQEPGAELILADDGSTRADTAHWLARHDAAPGLRILRARENRGIAHATNRALAVARGRWVGLVDHDDALEPHAVGRLRRTLRAHPDTLFLYTDEVIADPAMAPVSVFFKPAFDPVLLSGVNYVNHLSLYRRDRLAALGGLREGFHGSQDYELVLRYTRGLPAEAIRHLPYPAYRWRQRDASVSHSARDRATANARRALEEHFGTLVGQTHAAPALLPDLHRLRFPGARRPRVSIVIPNRDSFALIARVLEDLERHTDYRDFETIVIDNGSTDPRVPALYRRHRVRAEIRPVPFNFAAMVNRGVELATGEAILLLNNDISVIDPGWLDEMVECLAYPGTGVVGARLLFPDDRLQHAGVILGHGGLAGHWYYKAASAERGEMGRLACRNSLSAVTGACMLVTRDCWEALGGMDDARFAVAYNDVDFCARARGAGYGVIWTPFATLYHHESASRGSDLMGEKARRFRSEKAALEVLHDTGSFVDPALSPWYSRYQSHPRIVVGDRLAEARSFLGFASEPRTVPAAAPLRDARPTGDRQPMPRSARG